MRLTRNPVLVLMLIAPLFFLNACGGGGGTDSGNASGGGGSGANAPTTPPSDNSQPPASTPTATATAHSYAFVADRWISGNTMSVYRRGASADELTDLGTITVEDTNFLDRILVHPGGRFIYVSNTDTIAAYRVDVAPEALVPLGKTKPVGARPMHVAMAADGQFLFVSKNYVVDEGPAFGIPEIATYRIDSATGELTPAGTLVTGTPVGALVAPRNGNIVYAMHVVTDGSTPPTLSAYAIDVTSGSMTLVASTTTSAGSLTVNPDGMHAYIVYGDTVTVYQLDASAGTLTQIGVPGPAGVHTAMAVHPNGKFFYIANRDEIQTYRVDAVTGFLIPSAILPISDGPNQSPGPGQPGKSPQGDPFGFDPNGNFVYVGGESSLGIYGIDPVTGLLTAVGSVPRSGRGSAVAVAIVTVPDEVSGP
jgi:6-phosphogluconolactonase (cycloisomerase 2 family)